MRLWKRLALFLAVLAVVGILAEVVMQVLWADGEEFEFRFRTGTEVGANASTPFRLHHERFYTLKSHNRASDAHAGPFATDAWPFRGRVGTPLPDWMPRVALVGDSCVYGVGLRPAETLAAQVAEALKDRGLPPDRVAVLNFGVTGYSTVQILALLREAIERVGPDAVVLYPGAWNDQMAAILEPDHVMLERRKNPTAWQQVVQSSRILTSLQFFTESIPTEEIIAAWEAGEPLRGWRVPAALLDANVRTMVALAGEHGAPTVVIVPHQPAITRTTYPRTLADADAVRAAAREAGATLVDGPRVLTADGRSDDDNFVDFVHPGAEAVARLAAAVAEAVAPALAEAVGTRGPRPASPLAIEAVTPARTAAFGDVPLTVTLAGWSQDAPLPAVTVGHAPLLDLRASGPHTVTGLLGANAGGTHDVVVQTAADAAVLSDALRSEAPTLAVEPLDGGAQAVVTSRPGDHVRFFGSPIPRAAPKATSIGTWHLPGSWSKPDDPAIFAFDVEVGDDGRAVAALPPAALAADEAEPFHLQARVAPRGESLDDGATVVATPRVRWPSPPADGR